MGKVNETPLRIAELRALGRKLKDPPKSINLRRHVPGVEYVEIVQNDGGRVRIYGDTIQQVLRRAKTILEACVKAKV